MRTRTQQYTKIQKIVLVDGAMATINRCAENQLPQKTVRYKKEQTKKKINQMNETIEIKFDLC